MFLPDPFQDDPQQRVKKPAALTPQQVLDNQLKLAFPMRSWSPEQLRRYTDSLDPVLRFHMGLDPK